MPGVDPQVPFAGTYEELLYLASLEGGGGGPPEAHASTHEAGGDDAITVLADLTAPVTLTDGTFDRAVLGLDGSGLTLYDADGNPYFRFLDDGATHYTQWVNGDGALIEFRGTADATITVQNPLGSNRTVIAAGACNVYNTSGAGVIEAGESGIGVFAATPYGQDAFLADPDVTGLVDWAAAINALLIARGWMAAS